MKLRMSTFFFFGWLAPSVQMVDSKCQTLGGGRWDSSLEGRFGDFMS